MGKEIGIRAFARLADVSPAAVRKAIETARVEEGEQGIDPTRAANRFFVEMTHEKRVQAMELHGEIAPGWCAVAVPFPGQNPCPVFYIPPNGGENVVSGVDFEGWGFDPDAWIARDPAGKVHKLVSVIRRDAPPPWREEKRGPGRPPEKRKAPGARA